MWYPNRGVNDPPQPVLPNSDKACEHKRVDHVIDSSRGAPGNSMKYTSTDEPRSMNLVRFQYTSGTI